MPRFAANLSFLYGEFDFLDCFAAAAADGFQGVEFLFPYEYPAAAIAERLRGAQLEQVLFNLPPGDWAAGERGLAALPGREAEFAAALELSLDYAQVLGCRRLHAMAGIVAPAADRARMHAVYVANLRLAARRAAEHGIRVLIEPINARDMPGYFLGTLAQAAAVIAEVDEPNLRLQFDLYHAQVSEGDLTRKLERYLPITGHVQVASVPARAEPDSGEFDAARVFAQLDALGYEGWVGCEYRPRAGTRAGLGWFAPWRARTGG
jgi:hydroxypyruvate isomerase